MDPIMAGLAIGGSLIGAVGSIWSGYTQASAYRLNSEIAAGNAAMLDRTAGVQALDAPIEIKRGTFEQGKLVGRAEDVLGGQIAHFAGAGIDPSYGSPVQLAVATLGQYMSDMGMVAAQARYGAATAFGRAASTAGAAAAQAGQAFAFAERANESIIAGLFGAAGSLLKGGQTGWAAIANQPMPSSALPLGGGAGWTPVPAPQAAVVPASSYGPPSAPLYGYG